MTRSVWIVLICLAIGLGCSRGNSVAVEPVTEADAVASADPDASVASGDSAVGADTKVTATGVTGGGLWVVDANGQAIGVLVQRGHSSLSANGTVDILRDGALVYSPQTGLFFGVQLSSGKVISPRLGVTDASCAAPVVAGYYTDGDAISGPPYAFVYNGSWYRIEAYQPLQLVTCGGTVADGIDGKCAPHSGSCRGFPVTSIKPALPLQFAAPMQLSWVSK